MLLDTNILIGYINGDIAIRDAVSAWRAAEVRLIISSITLGEFLSHAALTDVKIRDLELFAATFISIPFDDELAKRAARLKRKYRFALTDSGILATAQLYGVSVVTRDAQLHKVTEVTFAHI
ncbi:MAG: PIN domain-containing protein [Patescibacteria group bacterium]